MKYCPECRTEYEDRFEKCADCGAELTGALEAEEEYIEGREAFLMTASGSLEAEMIKSRLKSFGIPVMEKYKGSSGYVNIYMGMTNLGVDLYVPENALEEAKELLDAQPEPGWQSEALEFADEEKVDSADDFDAREYREKARHILISVLSIVSAVSILLAILKRLGIF